MRVLIGCEYSAIIRSAFELAGHDAWSCDYLESEQPGNHIVGNVLDILHDNWDLAIFHPPCTFLCKPQQWMCNRDAARYAKQREAIEFVRVLLNAPIKRIALENPPGILSSEVRRPDQVIHPYMFGDQYRKEICLWLKNLPPLKPLPPAQWEKVRRPMSNHTNGRMTQTERSKIKSKFFYHVAQAMASQWGSL